MPEFIGVIACATSEDDIRRACEQIKSFVVESYPHALASRKNPMSEIRAAIRGKYPQKDSEAKFYFFTKSGKENSPRWEHLAIKYLEAEWDKKIDRSFEEDSQNQQKGQEIQLENFELKPDSDILRDFGLTSDELEAVNQAIGESDTKAWIKQAIMQRANAINNKKAVMDEDLTEVPSEILMNDKKYRTNSAAARELVSRAVRVVKQWNHDHPEHKWCITNKILGELTGVTVKAVAKAVEGMGLSEYNQGQGVEPLTNRFTKVAVGNPSEVICLFKVTGVEGTEKYYTLHTAVEEPTPTSTVETKKKNQTTSGKRNVND